jgi:hypothetical protein
MQEKGEPPELTAVNRQSGIGAMAASIKALRRRSKRRNYKDKRKNGKGRGGVVGSATEPRNPPKGD